ncbi:MAG: hypothetical protein EOO47_27645, partial [Flavobacterium sp.]
MKKTLPQFILVLIFCTSNLIVFSQKRTSNYYQAGFKKIDSLALATKPKEAIALINPLIEKARKGQNTAMLI